MRSPILLLTVVLALTAAACGDRVSNSFVGTYSMDRKGVLTEFIRIDRQGSGFVLSLKQGNAWVLPATVTPVEKAKLEALIKQPVSVSYESLGGDKIALLKLPAGARIGDFETKTGFAWATEFGLVEVQKKR